MKFSVASALAFAAAVLAQPRFLNADFQVEEGEPFTLRWGNAVGPVTITLMTGDPENLQEVTVITCKLALCHRPVNTQSTNQPLAGETGSEYTFTPSDWPSGTYAFRIEDSTDEPNYSERFQYTGTGEFTTTSTARTTTRTSTRTSSSSSSTESSSTSTETSTTSSSATTSTTTSMFRFLSMMPQ